jgi:LacI family transcriptional regulator
MVTIKQIAQWAGVSSTTVSNVLHGRHHKMKAEVLAKVRRILEETKYTPNMAGRLLANYGSRLIGVIMTYSRRNEQNVMRDPFHSEMIGALEREIRINGYFMMLYTSADVNESLRMAMSWKAEGIIVLGCHADDCALLMKSTNTPLVFIDSYFHDDGIPYINVGLEDRRGARLMAEYLIEKGHRHIAFLADGKTPAGVDYERLCGFREALEEHSIPYKDDHFIPISFKYEDRLEFFRAFVRERVRNYTALFFASDFYAVDTMNILHDLGLRVPDDLSIAGFDGNILSTFCRPLLTTVRQDVSEKAVHAVAQVIALIRKEPVQIRDIRLDVSLCPGKSVKKI